MALSLQQIFLAKFFLSGISSSYAAYYGSVCDLVYTLANIKVFLTLLRFSLIRIINF